MKSTLYNQLRNYAHLAKLFCFIYSIWFYCKAFEYTADSKIIGLSFGSVIIAAVYGGFWEWCQKVFLKAPFSYGDILKGIIGGFLGYLFYLINPNVEFIAKWCSLGCAGLVLVSIGLGLKLMYTRWKIRQNK
jgi:hypothetical protein